MASPNQTTLLWATDIHLDHVGGPKAGLHFGKQLRLQYPGASALLVTGDLSNAKRLRRDLLRLQEGFQHPLFYVLGNHDFYGGSFAGVDEMVSALDEKNPDIHWLKAKPQMLAEGVALVGTDGFYDAGYGNANSPLRLNDFTEIEELFEAQDESHQALLDYCTQRATADAALLEKDIDRACEQSSPSHCVVATHVPPFPESAWYKGRTADATWAPFFCSRASGAVLTRCAERYPRTQFIVLCGHAHGSGLYRPTGNLSIYTGGARYGKPALAGQLEIGPYFLKLTNKLEG